MRMPKSPMWLAIRSGSRAWLTWVCSTALTSAWSPQALPACLNWASANSASVPILPIAFTFGHSASQLVLSLPELPLNTPATIVRIDGSDHLTQRLLEFGLLEGDQIEIIGVAPLGDPLEI